MSWLLTRDLSVLSVRALCCGLWTTLVAAVLSPRCSLFGRACFHLLCDQRTLLLLVSSSPLRPPPSRCHLLPPSAAAWIPRCPFAAALAQTLTGRDGKISKLDFV